MRLRLIVSCALVLAAFWCLPSACLAVDRWDGSSMNIVGGTYTSTATVTVEYYGAYSGIPGGVPWAWLLAPDSDDLLHAMLLQPDDMGTKSGGASGVIYWCSGEDQTVLAGEDGLKTVSMRFNQGGMNSPVSPVYSDTIILDSHGPKTVAPYALKCKKGGYVTVSYQVDDSFSPSASVTLQAQNAAGKALKSVSLGVQETGKLVTYLWKPGLGRGKYKYAILATDEAGNASAKPGTNTLTVR